MNSLNAGELLSIFTGCFFNIQQIPAHARGGVIFGKPLVQRIELLFGAKIVNVEMLFLDNFKIPEIQLERIDAFIRLGMYDFMNECIKYELTRPFAPFSFGTISVFTVLF